MSIKDINLSELSYSHEGKIQLGSLRSRAAIFHAASAESMQGIVVATVGGKPFNLPLVVGKSRSNARGHGRGPSA